MAAQSEQSGAHLGPHRFARRGGRRRQRDVLLPGACAALHQRAQLRPSQGQVQVRVQPSARGEHQAVGVLALHHHLGRHQVDLRSPQGQQATSLG